MALKALQYKFNKNDESTNTSVKGQIIAFGIQATPGTKFYLNGRAEYPIIIGATGIYELDLRNGLGTITEITVESDASTDESIVLIDVLCEDTSSTISTHLIEEAERL